MTGNGIADAFRVALPIGMAIYEIADRATSGTATPEETARALIAQGLELVPVERLRELLTEQSIARANLTADAASLAKFGAR